MPTHHFNLASVAKENGTRAARGYLAEQGVDLCAKYPVASAVAAGLASLTRDRELPLLGLDVEVDEDAGELTIRPTGPLGRLMRKRTNRLTERLRSFGPPCTVREGGFVYNLYQPPVPSGRMVNHLARQIMRRSPRTRPSTCTLQVTARCQLDCYHCSAARFKNPARDELSLDEWREVIRQSLELGIFNIVFTGGEPLLRPDLLELIAAVDRDQAQAMMFTNGLLLTPGKVAGLVEAGLYSLNVSLDDPRPEVHNQLRRAPQGFQQALVGVQNALEGGLLVGISTYAGPEAVREGRIEQTVELAKGLGVHEVTIFDVVPTGKLLPLEEASLLSEQDKQHLCAFQAEYNQRPGCPHLVAQSFVNGPDGAGCFAAFSQFYLTAYGDMDPCDFTPLTFGNVRDESLEAIWDRMLEHPAYQQRCPHCRMQDQDFRRKYIDDIPEQAPLPWPACPELRDRPHGP
ncbi:MAG TPA: radical SAM protein [Armatimonadota bacterium]